MADFDSWFPTQNAMAWQPAADPVDAGPSTIIPYTTVQDFAPPVGTAITVITTPVNRSDPLIIQIDDTILIKNILANVKYLGRSWECAYDGAEFSPIYAQSTITKPSTTQWVLTLRRQGGWPFSPIGNVRAIDGAGNMS